MKKVVEVNGYFHGQEPQDQEPQDQARNPYDFVFKPQRQKPGLYIFTTDAAQREALLAAGAYEVKWATGARVLRVPLDELPGLRIDPARVTAYRSLHDAGLGRAMSRDDFSKAAGLGRGRGGRGGGSDSDTDSNSFHL